MFLISSYLAIKTFYPIFIAKEVIITYGIHPFDICSKNPELWNIIKNTYVFTFIFSNFIISNFLYSRILCKFKFFKPKKKIPKNNSTKIPENFNKNLNLLIGFDEETNSNVYIPESGLYQNFLVTGTIGSGKTSSAMYPFTNQLLKYNYYNLFI